MGKIADGDTRVAHGFPGLRRRYVRRAEFLTTDPDFRATTADYRRQWREKLPDFPVPAITQPPEPGVPAFICDLAEQAEREREAVMDELRQLRPPSLRSRQPMSERERVLFAKWSELVSSPAIAAQSVWESFRTQLTRRYFQWEDFPVPYPEGSHPSSRFIAASLHGDPVQWVGRCDEFIPSFELVPFPTIPYDSLAGVDELEDADDQFPEPDPYDESQWLLVLPLYPGITARDICEAAPQIAERVNVAHANKTVAARVHALRAEGLTHQRIADRLGMTAQNVARILAGA
jgi:hypothetical protein